MKLYRITLSLIYATIVILLLACSHQNTDTNLLTTPVSTAYTLPEEYTAIESIVNKNTDWPRKIISSDGIIEIPSPPQRILTLSLGHDEIVLALLQDTDRMAGISKYTVYPEYSNIADKVQELPPVSANVEEIVKLNPDIVIVSKYTNADTVQLLNEIGITVFRSDLENSVEGNIPNILTLGYLIGEEEQAIKLTRSINARLDRISNITNMLEENKVRVLAATSYGGSIWVSGDNSTTGRIIELAGGINTAKEAGLDSELQVSVESIISMAPDIIIIPQSQGGEEFANYLMNDPIINKSLPHIKDKVVVVGGQHFTTLSHWNICGVEDLVLILYPEQAKNINNFLPCEQF